MKTVLLRGKCHQRRDDDEGDSLHWTFEEAWCRADTRARSDEEGRASETATLLRSDVTVDAAFDATRYSSSETNPLRFSYGRCKSMKSRISEKS